MRRLTIVITAAALALSACGGDDDEPETGASGPTGATGAQGVATSSGIATAGDYLEASIPEQGEAVQELADAEPACEGVNAKLGGDLQVGVAIAAASAEPATELAGLVASECEGR